MRGSNVTRILPGPATSVRSTAWAASIAPVRAGLTSARVRARALIAKRHPPMGGCRRGYPAARAWFALRHHGRNRGAVLGVDCLDDLFGDQAVGGRARMESVAGKGGAERVRRAWLA